MMAPTFFGKQDAKENLKNKKIKIAILGAGTGGLFAAISLIKKFGDKVDVFIFEKQASFDLEKGVELSVGPTFQLAMLRMGLDVKKLRKFGYPHKYDQRVRNTEFQIIESLEKNLEGQQTDFYTDVVSNDTIKTRLQLYEYSTKRGILMDFLQSELMRISDHNVTIHWNCNLKEMVLSEKNKKKFIFSDGNISQEFDFVIGADGVHSQVRKLLFDQEPPHHVGANILYGVIPGDVEGFEPNRFHIIISGNITAVLSRNVESDRKISTWWAVIYPDQENIKSADVAFWEKRNDPVASKNFVSELAVKNNHSVLKKLIDQTPDQNFKYSGKFLERNPAALNEWGKDNVVLVGDAVHAMMPWAGIGAGMAAEDITVLLSLFEKYKVFDNLETLETKLADDTLSKIYNEYKKTRLDRINYFYTETHQMAPDGILSTNGFNLMNVDIKKEYGDQHALTSAPYFNDLLTHELASIEARNDFFEKIEADENASHITLSCSN